MMVQLLIHPLGVLEHPSSLRQSENVNLGDYDVLSSKHARRVEGESCDEIRHSLITLGFVQSPQ